MEHVYGEQRQHVGYPYSTPQDHGQSIYPGSQEQAYFPAAPQEGVPPTQFPSAANASVTRVVIPAKKSGWRQFAFPLAMPLELEQSRVKITPSSYEGHIKAVNSIFSALVISPFTYGVPNLVAVIALIAVGLAAFIAGLQMFSGVMLWVVFFVCFSIQDSRYAMNIRAAMAYCDGIRENDIRWSFQCSAETQEVSSGEGGTRLKYEMDYHLIIEFNWPEEQRFGIQQAYVQPMIAGSTETQYAGIAAVPYQADFSVPKNEPNNRVAFPTVEREATYSPPAAQDVSASHNASVMRVIIPSTQCGWRRIEFPLPMPFELEQSRAKITPSVYADHIKAVNRLSAKVSSVPYQVFTFFLVGLIACSMVYDILAYGVDNIRDGSEESMIILIVVLISTFSLFFIFSVTFVLTKRYAMRKATSYCGYLQKIGIRCSLQPTTQCTLYGADYGPDENTTKYLEKYILVVELD